MKKILSKLLRRLEKFSKLPWHKRFILIEAFIMLGIGRVTALLVPIGRIKENIEKSINRSVKKSPDNTALSTGCTSKADIIKWAVAAMSRYTPWKSNCFAQALAAFKMLIRRGIPTTMYFGLAKKGEGEMSAHAWLMYGETVITGGNESPRFSAVMMIGHE